MGSFINAIPGAIGQGLIWGIMAIGVYITFRVLDFADLTVDGTLATGGAALVTAMMNGVNVYVALVIAFAAGCLAGLVTGLLNTAFGIPPILAGILTQLALYSINLRILGKANQPVSSYKYHLICTMSELNKALLVATAFVLVIIAILYWFFGKLFIFRILFGIRGCNIVVLPIIPMQALTNGCNDTELVNGCSLRTLAENGILLVISMTVIAVYILKENNTLDADVVGHLGIDEGI